MNLKTLERPVFQNGLTYDAFSKLPAVSSHYGLNQPRSQEVRKEITSKEAQKLLGVSQSVKMNFIPQMLVAVALDQAMQFVRYCRKNGIQKFKKHNRLIRQCIDEYRPQLRKSYGKAFAAYSDYVARYFKYVEMDRLKMWFSIGNVANRQLTPDIDRDGAVHIAIVHGILKYAESYDRKMDRLLEEKLGTPIRRKRDDMLKLVVAMCIEFEESYGFQLKPDPIIDLCVSVMANKASALADEIIYEEANVSKS